MNARITLLPHQEAEIAALREAWMTVGAIGQRGSPHCETCRFCELDGITAPYGDSITTETFSTCVIAQFASSKPTECPAYAARLAEEAWQAQGEAEMAQGAEA
jgi:hypothetical protein